MQKYVRLLNNGGFQDVDQYVGKVFPVPGDSYNLVEVKFPDGVTRYFDISDGEAEYVEYPEASLDVALSNFMRQTDEMIKALEETQAALKATSQENDTPKVGDFVKIKTKEYLKVDHRRYSSRCDYVGQIVREVDRLSSDRVFSVEFKQVSFPEPAYPDSYYITNFYESEFEVVPEDTEGLEGCQPSMGMLGVKADLKTLTNIPEEMVYMTGEFYTEFIRGHV